MYKAFFGLARNPFELTPDPACFVATRRHNEALAALYYGVRWHKGFVVVTGEVGTGKTMLLRCLLDLLKGSDDIAYAYLFNSRLSATEFLQYILSDLGLRTSGKNKSEMLFEFGKYLIGRGENQQTTVLIVDEAHSISDDLLEEIRLLSNLETTDSKLLQIVLVGQPELDEKLDSAHLRQLKQRIALRAQLGPLSLEEATEYISRRMEIAGRPTGAEPIFPPETIAAVHRNSNGLPRLINTICENALIGAYSQQQPRVSPQIVDRVATDFRLNLLHPAMTQSEAIIPVQVPIPPATNALGDLFGMSQKLVNDKYQGTAFPAESSKASLSVVSPVKVPAQIAPPAQAEVQPATDVLRDLFGISKKVANGNYHDTAVPAESAVTSLKVVHPLKTAIQIAPSAQEVPPATDVLRDLFGISKKPAHGTYRGMTVLAETAIKI